MVSQETPGKPNTKNYAFVHFKVQPSLKGQVKGATPFSVEFNISTPSPGRPNIAKRSACYRSLPRRSIYLFGWRPVNNQITHGLLVAVKGRVDSVYIFEVVAKAFKMGLYLLASRVANKQGRRVLERCIKYPPNSVGAWAGAVQRLNLAGCHYRQS